MKNKGLKRKSDPNKYENVTEYECVHKDHISRNEEHLSSLDLGNK